jgi:hypothetical protein
MKIILKIFAGTDVDQVLRRVLVLEAQRAEIDKLL